MKGEVGRGSGKKPGGAIRAQRELSLGTRLAGKFVLAHTRAVSASAIPLREPAPGRRTEDLNAHLAELEFCAHVGVDFAAENDFFENRTGPSHSFHLQVRDFPRRTPWRGVGGVEE